MAAYGQVAQFQGVLNVPMYSAPFNMPNNGSPMTWYPTTGESPLLSYDLANYAPQSQFTNTGLTVGVTGATIYGMNYLNAYLLNVGAGYQNIPATAKTQAPLMFQNNIVFPNMMGVPDSAIPGEYFFDVAYSFAPFASATNLTSMPARNTAQSSMVYGTDINSNGFIIGASRMVISYIIEITTQLGPFVFPAGNAMGLGTIFDGPSFGYCLQADNKLSGQAASWSLGGGGELYEQSWIIPAREINANYLWALFEGAPYVSYLQVNFNLLTASFFEGPSTGSGFQLWGTDNAALNALINASQVVFTPCATGTIMTTSTADYFISKDGARYWQLVMQAVNPNVLRNGLTSIPQGNDITYSKWIDASGILWYCGHAAQDNGGTGSTYPLYSLALNIPNNVPQINLNFPPIAGQCWSPCLDRIGGRPGNLLPTGMPYAQLNQ